MHTKRTLFYLVSSRHLSSSSLFRMESRSDILTIGVWIEIAWQHKINVWFFLVLSLFLLLLVTQSGTVGHLCKRKTQTVSIKCPKMDRLLSNRMPKYQITRFAKCMYKRSAISAFARLKFAIAHSMNTRKWWAWHNRNMSINLLFDVIIEHCGDHSFSAE